MLDAEAACAQGECLPATSKHRYNKIFQEFEKWRQLKQVKIISEKLLLEYFNEMSRKYKPSSLWAYYSMLKSTIKMNCDVDIASYHRLSEFLKTKGAGYKPTKTKVFTEQELAKFISDAPDGEWLDRKVSLY